MTELIKQNYSLLEDKSTFRAKVSKIFGVRPSTVETSWFSKGHFPQEHEKKILTMVKAEVKRQSLTV